MKKETKIEISPCADQKKRFLQLAISGTKDFAANPPPIAPFADWDYYYTCGELRWEANNLRLNSINRVIVPKGFVTDLASIPRIFWTILPPTSRYTYPAIMHDYLYWTQPCDRQSADNVFDEAMRELGIDNTKILIIINALKLAGGRAWRANAYSKKSGEGRILKRFPENLNTTWDEWRRQADVFSDI